MLDREIIGAFIDAAVDDHHRAKRLLRRYPALRDARWLFRRNRTSEDRSQLPPVDSSSQG